MIFFSLVSESGIRDHDIYYIDGFGSVLELWNVFERSYDENSITVR